MAPIPAPIGERAVGDNAYSNVERWRSIARGQPPSANANDGSASEKRYAHGVHPVTTAHAGVAKPRRASITASERLPINYLQSCFAATLCLVYCAFNPFSSRIIRAL
jgi:hypothetical protein